MWRWFGRTFTLLFLFFGLLDFVFDTGEVFQDFRAVFGNLALAAKLQFEELFEDLVEFRSALDAQRFEFAGRRAPCAAGATSGDNCESWKSARGLGISTSMKASVSAGKEAR